MARVWIRLDLGLLDDDRFNAVPPEAQWLWLRLYLRLADTEGVAQSMAALQRHAYREAAPFFARDRAEALLDELLEQGLITEDGSRWVIRGWDKYQTALDRTGAARQRRYRERQKAEQRGKGELRHISELLSAQDG